MSVCEILFHWGLRAITSNWTLVLENKQQDKGNKPWLNKIRKDTYKQEISTRLTQTRETTLDASTTYYTIR